MSGLVMVGYSLTWLGAGVALTSPKVWSRTALAAHVLLVIGTGLLFTAWLVTGLSLEAVVGGQ